MLFWLWGVAEYAAAMMMVADEVSTNNKSDRKMTRVVMDGWANVCMDGCVDGSFAG